ncbi:MAG TPA: hypothetical protein ENI62_07735, partial [Gammaproteobacteria bacterium]|nr:hypothetical protein [Gammaproteobacteria bacterium]
MFLKPVYTLLASNSHFACRALTRLCTAGVAPSTIALPGTVPSVLPIRHRSAAGTDIISLAFKYRVPLLDLPLQQPDAWPAMLSIGTDSCLLSTCFPARIPGSLWKTTACFNLHPSLLPAYRGPTPLFWQFHRGEHHTGVTLHRVNAEFDGGDIVSLKTLDLAPGIALRTVEAKLASLGTELFLTLLQDLQSAKSLPCRVQDRTRIQYN